MRTARRASSPVVAAACAAACAVAAGSVACHVVTEQTILRPGAHHHDADRGAAVARSPTLVIDDDAALRFVAPLDCPGLDVVDQDEVITRSTQPNIAAVAVGLLVTAAGGIITAVGGVDGNVALALGGVAGLALGLPLAIGPFVGDGDVDRAGAPHAPLRHGGTSEPCGFRPLAAAPATLDAVGVEVAGQLDGSGAFSVSPFLLVDAFDPRATGAWDLRAATTTGSGDVTFHTVIETDALVRGAKAFLAHADFDARAEPLRVVPGVAAAAPIGLVFTSLGDAPAVRVHVSVTNAGPGDAWQLRGQLETGVRALDGRMLYFGHVAHGDTATRDLVIPVTGSTASALRNATIDVAVQLRDAHGTAPSTPLKFHGPIISAAPAP